MDEVQWPRHGFRMAYRSLMWVAPQIGEMRWPNPPEVQLVALVVLDWAWEGPEDVLALFLWLEYASAIRRSAASSTTMSVRRLAKMLARAVAMTPASVAMSLATTRPRVIKMTIPTRSSTSDADVHWLGGGWAVARVFRVGMAFSWKWALRCLCDGVR